ncbi:MAG: glycosyltransferase [Thermoanaerobaculia bacterium]
MTVVVPTWNSARWLPGCLAALRAQTLEPEEVLVVDSASTDGTIEALGEGGSVRWLALSANHGFAAAANAGWRSARTPWVALLNPDTAPEAGWLRALAEALAASDARVWAIASKMLRMVDPDVVDDAGDSLTRFGAAVKRGHGEPERSWCEADDVLSPCAGAALYRRDVLEASVASTRLGAIWKTWISGCSAPRGLALPPRAEARVLHQGGGSGLPRPHYVRLVTCNRLLLLLKDLPARLLVRHSLRLLRGQLYFLLAYHRPLASLQGYLRFLRLLPHTLRARRQVQGARRVAVEEVDGWLLRERGTPPLRSLLRRPG